MNRVWKGFTDLFEDDDPAEPRFDPVHLAGVLVAVQVVAGVLFWLLWTLLVYEGGLPAKLGLLLGGPRDPDALRGLWGNLAALALCAGLVVALERLDRRRR
ncbi:MAG: hypothetical protein SF051_02515 [Elusimicrobiota bacterium]|nr:hypothetical protein [Elusimicrobiota bacterium]